MTDTQAEPFVMPSKAEIQETIREYKKLLRKLTRASKECDTMSKKVKSCYL